MAAFMRRDKQICKWMSQQENWNVTTSLNLVQIHLADAIFVMWLSLHIIVDLHFKHHRIICSIQINLSTCQSIAVDIVRTALLID